jgi:hypothetical protein
MAEGIVKIKLGRKILPAVICVLAAVVRMEGEKWLVERGSGRMAVKEVHREVEVYQIYEHQALNDGVLATHILWKPNFFCWRPRNG